MSHCISLFKFSDKKLAEFNRAGLGNDDRHTIYKIMGYEFADAGVSGDGSSWILYKEDEHPIDDWIKQAKKLKQDDLIEFFETMKDEVNKNGSCLIQFA